MSERTCKYERQIGEYFTKVDRHNKILEDNGNPGLVTVVTELKHSVDNLVAVVSKQDSTIEKLSTALSAIEKTNIDLMEWQEDCKEEEDKKERNSKDDADYKLKKKNLTWYIILILITGINVAANLIFK